MVQAKPETQGRAGLYRTLQTALQTWCPGGSLRLPELLSSPDLYTSHDAWCIVALEEN